MKMMEEQVIPPHRPHVMPLKSGINKLAAHQRGLNRFRLAPPRSSGDGSYLLKVKLLDLCWEAECMRSPIMSQCIHLSIDTIPIDLTQVYTNFIKSISYHRVTVDSLKLHTYMPQGGQHIPITLPRLDSSKDFERLLLSRSQFWIVNRMVQDGSEPLRMDNTSIYLLVLKRLRGLIP